MPGIATNRSNVSLPTEVSAEIIQNMQEASAVMQLARQIALPGRGLSIPVITSDPAAAWVEETDEKAVSNPGLSTKIMQAYKLAVIVPFSDEFRRDMAALYDALIARLPAALGCKFDQTVVGAVQAPGENFDTFAAATAQSIVSTPYAGLVAAYTDIAEHGGSLNGFALSPAAMGILLGAADQQGRPLFIDSPAEGGIGRILGARTLESRGLYKAGTAGEGTDAGTPAIVGVAGDWSKAMYGTVEGVQISISDQATLKSGTTEINLWQRNMFAVRAEIEIGFRADVNAFNLLTGATPTA